MEYSCIQYDFNDVVDKGTIGEEIRRNRSLIDFYKIEQIKIFEYTCIQLLKILVPLCNNLYSYNYIKIICYHCSNLLKFFIHYKS